MKKSALSTNLSRVKAVIESDRLNVSDNFDELITADLLDVLSEYFDLLTPPVLTVSKENGGYLIKIQALSGRIKNFGVLPKN